MKNELVNSLSDRVAAACAALEKNGVPGVDFAGRVVPTAEFIEQTRSEIESGIGGEEVAFRFDRICLEYPRLEKLRDLISSYLGDRQPSGGPLASMKEILDQLSSRSVEQEFEDRSRYSQVGGPGLDDSPDEEAPEERAQEEG